MTSYDPFDRSAWSGSGYFMAGAVGSATDELRRIGPLARRHRVLMGPPNRVRRLLGRTRYQWERTPRVLRAYARAIEREVSSDTPDVILSPGSLPLSRVETECPMAIWTDASFASMVDFYPNFTNLSRRSLRYGHLAERSTLERVQLAIYTSDWAAQGAIDTYGISAAKVRVVPFGANLAAPPSSEEVAASIRTRAERPCRLLFVGVDWWRKGADIAVETATRLNESGLQTELTLVGCKPPRGESLPDFVRLVGFLDKTDANDIALIEQLYREAHFLLLPARAECAAVVLAEANAYGVPCVASDVGGTSTMVVAGRNGELVPAGADGAAYAAVIADRMREFTDYASLAADAHREYRARLNWTVAGQTVRGYLGELVALRSGGRASAA